MVVSFVGGWGALRSGRGPLLGGEPRLPALSGVRMLDGTNLDVNVTEVATVRIDELGWSSFGGGGQTLQTCSGWVVDAKHEGPVVFMSHTSKCTKKSVARGIPGQAVVSVPSQLSLKQAAALPFVVFNAEAIVRLIEDHFGPKDNIQVVIVGGSTKSYLISRLLETGGAVAVVSTNGAKTIRQDSRIRHINPRKESFSEALPKIDLVIDSLSADFGPSCAFKVFDAGLASHPDAKYVSTALPELASAVKEGVLGGGSAILRRSLGQTKLRGDVFWQPNETAVQLVEEAVDKLATDQSLIDAIPDSVVRFDDLLEAIRFPRDIETGYRFGFDRISPDEEVDEEESISMDSPDESSHGIVDAAVDMVAGNTITSMDGLRHIVKSQEHDLVILYVSAPWCRRCAFIRPKYEKVSREMNARIAMLVLNSESNSELAEALGVDNVPAFLVYRSGKRIAANIDGNTKEGLRESILELVRD